MYDTNIYIIYNVIHERYDFLGTGCRRDSPRGTRGFCAYPVRNTDADGCDWKKTDYFFTPFRIIDNDNIAWYTCTRSLRHALCITTDYINPR